MMCRINRLSHPGKILLIGLILVISSCSGDMKVTTVANYQKYKNTPLGVEVLKLSSSDTQDGCYGEGSIITLDMELTDALTVDDPSTLSIPLVLGESIRQANYSSGNGSAVFHFVYQVAAGDNSPRLQYAEGASLTLTPLAIAGKNLVQAKIQPKSLTLPATTALESLGSLKKIIIDTTAPKLPNGLAFSKSLAAQGDDPILTWSASDDANFKDYELKLCAKDDCESSCTTLQRISSPEAHFSGFVDGSYHACVRAWDHALNSSAFAASAGKIELDRTAPEAPSSVVFDKAYYSGSAAKISFNPSKDLDLDFYRAKICRQADCQNQCAGEQTLKKLTAEFSLQEAQPVFACVQAVDKVGNVSAWTASLQTALSDSQAPLIDLGVARRAGTSFTLRPSVTDASPLSYAWTQVSGPGSIQFESATAKDTLIAADQEGVYQLKLTVSDATGHSSSAQVQLSWDRSLVLSLGRSDSCAIYPRGELRCWGRNNSGQLGYNSRKMIPTVPGGAVNLGSGRSALSVSVGGFHTCAILDDSSIKCWGLNSSGELGYGDNSDRLLPESDALQLGLGRRALAVSTGFNHTCAVLDNGAVKCWGGNSSGQLGYGDTTNRSSPPEQSLDLGSGRTALAISTSMDSSCALLDNGSVKCWGSNTHGQLGYGDTTQRLSPGSLAIDFGGGLTVKNLPRGGSRHFCVILSDGTARCWGNNGSYALGDGTSTNRSTPVAIQTSSLSNPTQLAPGNGGTCALFAGGIVSCWGDNGAGQLGIGRKNFASSCSDGISTTQLICLAAGGTWDGNYASFCSNGISTSSSVCTTAGGTWASCSDWTKASSGACTSPKTWDTAKYSYCTNTAGTRTAAQYCADTGGTWITAGYCGDANFASRIACLAAGKTWYSGTKPGVNLDFGAGKTALVISNSFMGAWSCVLLNDGKVKCWGVNDYGTLGYGDALFTTSFSAPLDLGAGRTVLKTVGGLSGNTCALLDNASVRCWGNNSSGLLGNGNYTDSAAPASPINFGQGVSDLALGQIHGCAILSDGSLKCWGENSSGQLGNGTLTASPTPVAPASLGGTVVDLAVSVSHTCVILDGGVVKCWGSGSGGRLGVGMTATATACSDGVSTSSGTCATNGATWHANFQDCSNGNSKSPAACTAIGGTWASCSNGTSSSSSACTTASKTWNAALYGYCVGASTACTAAGASWGNYGYCSTPTYKSRAVCLAAGASWYVNTQPGASVDFGAGVTATKLTAGQDFTCALLSNATVKCWGGNGSGQIGVGDSNTTNVYYAPANAIDFGAHTVKRLGGGRLFGCAVLDDDSLRCWGYNPYSQLGIVSANGSNLTAPSMSSADFGSNRSVRSLANGTMSATANCIISSDDKLLCFGNFGLSDYWIDPANKMTEAWNLQTSAVPQTVSVSGDSPAVCVSFVDGTLRCTGYNSNGQLGTGFPVNRFAPPAAAVTTLGL